MAYLSPNLFGFLLFTALPVLAVFLVAFTTGEYTSRIDPETGEVSIDAEWCGLQHFERMAKGLPVLFAGEPSALERQLLQAPLSDPADLQALGRALFEVALADGRRVAAEDRLLETWVDEALLTDPPPRLMGERAEAPAASPGPTRETIVLLAWTAAHADGVLAEPEATAVAGVAEALEVAPERARAQQDAAEAHLAGEGVDAAVRAGPHAPWEVRGDPEFWRSLWNTFVILLAIPLQMALALGLALLINQRGIPGTVVFRTLLFLPTVAAGVALYMLWRQIYNQEFGLLNRTLEAVWLVSPGGGPDWLGSPDLAKPSIVLMLVWIGMGGTNMVLYLAGLQDIDPSLYEAAEIDGAGGWDKFVHITWPALRPTTFFILTTNLIAGVQIFDQILIMTGGGPEGATTTVLYYIYRNIYEYQGQVGYAAAISVVLFFLIFLVTLLNWTINKRARTA